MKRRGGIATLVRLAMAEAAGELAIPLPPGFNLRAELESLPACFTVDHDREDTKLC